MKLFELAHPCLLDILDKKITFKLAVENTAKKHLIFKEDRKKLSNIVGCALRHYYVFNSLIKRVKESYTNEQEAGLLLYLADELFLSLVPSGEKEEFLKKLSIEKKEIKALFELAKDKEHLIPEEFSHDSLQYLSYL